MRHATLLITELVSLSSQICFSCMDSTEVTLILSLRYSHLCQETRHTCPSSQLLLTNQNSTSHTTQHISLRTEVASRQRALLLLISPVKVRHTAHPSANNKTAFLRCLKHAKADACSSPQQGK